MWQTNLNVDLMEVISDKVNKVCNSNFKCWFVLWFWWARKWVVNATVVTVLTAKESIEQTDGHLHLVTDDHTRRLVDLNQDQFEITF